MAKNNYLSNILANLGLKKTEAEVYLSTLEQGRATVLSLAQKTGIKRGTIYEITSRLLDAGFLKTAIFDNKRCLVAVNPRTIAARFQERVSIFSDQLPQFLALQNSNETKPKVTYFEGEDEVWQIYDETLEQVDDILSFTSVIDINLLLDPKRIADYIERRVRKNIPIKIIALDSDVSRHWVQKGQKELREIRIVPKEKYSFSADVEIYGNKVAIISYKEKVFGLVIDSEEISQMYRAAFGLMWLGAKEVGK